MRARARCHCEHPDRRSAPSECRLREAISSMWHEIAAGATRPRKDSPTSVASRSEGLSTWVGHRRTTHHNGRAASRLARRAIEQGKPRSSPLCELATATDENWSGVASPVVEIEMEVRRLGKGGLLATARLLPFRFVVAYPRRCRARASAATASGNTRDKGASSSARAPYPAYHCAT
jgi:hypothetical protein